MIPARSSTSFLIELTLFLALGSILGADPLRQSLNLNRDWRFKLGDQTGASQSNFNDSAWEAVGLPHSFSAPYFQWKDFYTGDGWYRRHLTVRPEWSGRREFLEFEGVFQVADVFVNGTPVGTHRGGYTGFSLDITSALHAGDNVIAVRVNNNWDARLAPRAGDFNFIGGIYRDVNLVVTDPLHVTWYGTFVTTPDVSKASSTVDIKTEIQNQGTTGKTCRVDSTVLDPDGQPVAKVSSTLEVAAGATVNFDQTSTVIPNPKLWHPDHPFMYRVATTVSDGTRPADDFSTPFGFRWIKWTADQGFFINGEHLYFHGANVHQDHAGWANAVTQAGVFRDVKLIKEAGLDFIRGSHYPHHPVFADACDQLGVLFWSENCFWAVGGAHKEGGWSADAYPPVLADQAPFERSTEDTLRDEIRIFRNHPSIVAWSMCNEVFFSSLPNKVKPLLTKLVALSHELDPTRPAAIGGAQRGGLATLGDIAGYNGDGARLYINPGFPSAVTEYGSVSSNRPGAYDGQFKNSDNLTATTPEFPWRSGQVVWCGFDYGTILGPLAGSKGLVDYFRVPKRSWFWYRNELLKIPPPDWPLPGTPAKLGLTADKTVIHGTDATDDCQIVVTVFDQAGKALSNSPPVTFTIESGPGEFPTGRRITFAPDSDIYIRDGKAAMEFRSYEGGQTVIRATSPGLADATLSITTEGDPQFVSGRTAVAPDRPYTRFVPTKTATVTDQNVAQNRPTSASSEAAGHSGAMAVDGNPSTYWAPTTPGAGAWWEVDLEQPHTVQAMVTTLHSPGNYRYRIEGSPDGNTWTLLADESATTNTERVRTDTFPAGEHFQFLRVTFTGVPEGQSPAIDEVQIKGQHYP